MANAELAKRFDLTGRVAFVSGASSGFGRHFAEVLARAGASVAVGARRMDRLVELRDRLAPAGCRILPVALDVTDPASPPRAIAEAEATLGPVTILICNAGVPGGAMFLDTTEEQWRSVLDVNLDGVFRLGQAGARRMKANGTGGSIINMASVAAFGVLKGISAYHASKAAVVNLTRAMALELAKDRIRVNALAPGYVPTELNDAFLATDAGKRLIARVPFARVGRLDELDGPLLLLASDAGSYMTGSTIVVDGGTLLAMG